MDSGIDKVAFFSVALKNGLIMSRPRYEPVQAFMGSLMQEIEHSDPEFAWFQFVFRVADYTPHLRTLKADLHQFKRFADQPVLNRSGEKAERKEKASEWYRSIDLWTKKIEETLPLPKVVMGIQGMWVGDRSFPTTFNHCSDDIDSLAVFRYRDPRMLVEIVERRVVEDVRGYFGAFHSGSRREPPSLVLAADDLPHYIHVPTGKTLEQLASLDRRAPSSPIFQTKREPDIPMGRPVSLSLPSSSASATQQVRVAAMAGVPFLQEALDREKLARLRNVPSRHLRSFEVVYDRERNWPEYADGSTPERMRILVSSRDEEDLSVYEQWLASIYGSAAFVGVEKLPPYLLGLKTKLAPKSR